MEEMANPRMKQTSGVYKLFRSLDSSYVEDVLNSMDDYQQIGVGRPLEKGGATHGTNLEA